MDHLQLRPIFHQLEHRIEAHIYVAFLAYCLHVTLRAKLKPLAPDGPHRGPELACSIEKTAPGVGTLQGASERARSAPEPREVVKHLNS